MRSNRKRQPSLEKLQQQFPEATAAECQRFRQANPRDSVEKLTTYLEWRQKYKLSDDVVGDESTTTTNHSQDWEDWNRAVQKVISSLEGWTSHNGSGEATSCATADSDKSSAHGTQNDTSQSVTKRKVRRGSRKKESKSPQPRGCDTSLRGGAKTVVPQLIVGPVGQESNETIRDVTGHRVFCHLPARIDLKSATVSYEAYAEIMALYVESKLNRQDKETMTLLVDVRPGPKWKNPPAIQMLGFIRQVAHRVNDLLPGRLHRCIIYPVPLAAVCIWHLVRNFLNAQIRDLLVVIPGCAATSQSPTPTKALEEYLDLDALVCLEKARQQSLVE